MKRLKPKTPKELFFPMPIRREVAYKLGCKRYVEGLMATMGNGDDTTSDEVCLLIATYIRYIRNTEGSYSHKFAYRLNWFIAVAEVTQGLEEFSYFRV